MLEGAKRKDNRCTAVSKDRVKGEGKRGKTVGMRMSYKEGGVKERAEETERR